VSKPSKLYLIVLFTLLLSLTACQTASPTPTATVAPTAEPTAEPTVEAADTPQTLRLATTTSTDDSGLLDAILPVFEEEFNVTVDVIAVGTGQALELGRNGDVDVVLVHDRAREDAFVAEGHGVARFDVMYNDFIIVGPEADPAGIADSATAVEAFTTIAGAEAPFISRGDDSGTHGREKSIWALAEIEPAGDWYQSTGQGMGEVLTIANEQQAYTLADRGTYLSRLGENFELVILVEGDDSLLNPYGVIPVNPEKNDSINGPLAEQFVNWLTSVETQELIAGFTINGEPLFFPDSETYRAAQE
jgi:tungstate transport system substrate-binding protein